MLVSIWGKENTPLLLEGVKTCISPYENQYQKIVCFNPRYPHTVAKMATGIQPLIGAWVVW